MSIIVEEHADIPLFDRLKPTRTHYVLDGNHLEDIYEFYMKELPAHGWKSRYIQHGDASASGFLSHWRKEGFDGELTVSASYFQSDDRTEVMFDKHPLFETTTWIYHTPDSVCIYMNLNQDGCTIITNPNIINDLIKFINDSIDWNEKRAPRPNISKLVFGDLEVEVLYGNKE
jgi:hypothetical protein